MTKEIQREFNRFADFLAQADDTDLDGYRDRLYQRIDNLIHLIDHEPDKEDLKQSFYHLFDSFDQSLIHQRAREKPLGYAGDYLLIDWIYTQKTAQAGLGQIYDRLFHSYEAAQSVRNRKQFFIRKCLDMSHKKKSRIDILNVGCGPCRDVLDTFEASSNGRNLHFHCVDHEPEAISYAQHILAHSEAQNNITFECANCFKIKTEKQFDLIWSAGLFDYLEDRLAILLLKRLWKKLKPGGQIIFGNFSPKNPTRKGMELGCHWVLIHRTAEELVQICRKAEIPFSELDIESEELGINLFCIVTK